MYDSEYGRIIHRYKAVCENGHVNALKDKASCRKCKGKTIQECPSCQTKIEGRVTYEHFHRKDIYPYPFKCKSCAMKFPWMEMKMKDVYQTLEYENKLNEKQKNNLTECILLYIEEYHLDMI